MSEAEVTLSIVRWLRGRGWKIVSYDYPQSGTGLFVHPADRSSKNFKSIVPDILAQKDGKGVWFENKDRYYAPDFNKIRFLRGTHDYDKSLTEAFSGLPSRLYYGVGLSRKEGEVKKSLNEKGKIEFLVTVDTDETVRVEYASDIDF